MHCGQVAHPSPELVSRTIAPVTMITTLRTSEATVQPRNARTVENRRVRRAGGAEVVVEVTATSLWSASGRQSAEPLANSSYEVFQSVQPLPFSSPRLVPVTLIRSPTLQLENNHEPFAVLTPMQPWLTFARP